MRSSFSRAVHDAQGLGEDSQHLVDGVLAERRLARLEFDDETPAGASQLSQLLLVELVDPASLFDELNDFEIPIGNLSWLHDATVPRYRSRTSQEFPSGFMTTHRSTMDGRCRTFSDDKFPFGIIVSTRGNVPPVLRTVSGPAALVQRVHRRSRRDRRGSRAEPATSRKNRGQVREMS